MALKKHSMDDLLEAIYLRNTTRPWNINARYSFGMGTLGSKLTCFPIKYGPVPISYDALNRLYSLTHPGNPDIAYGYDPSGNRTGLTINGTWALSYTYDDANRLISIILPNG